jgi:hypothetical protein
VLRVERCDAIRCDGGRGDCRGGQALIGIDTGRVNRLMIGTHHLGMPQWRCRMIIMICTVQDSTCTSRIGIDPLYSLDLWNFTWTSPTRSALTIYRTTYIPRHMESLNGRPVQLDYIIYPSLGPSLQPHTHTHTHSHTHTHTSNGCYAQRMGPPNIATCHYSNGFTTVPPSWSSVV